MHLNDAPSIYHPPPLPDTFLPIISLTRVGFQNPKLYNLPFFIRMLEQTICQYIVSLWYEKSAPLTTPKNSHFKRCNPYPPSFPHLGSSLHHHPNRTITLHHDELGSSSLSESFSRHKCTFCFQCHTCSYSIRSNELDHSSFFRKTR